jgi:eukaryotic-like serine/threonine-protein kinase
MRSFPAGSSRLVTLTASVSLARSVLHSSGKGFLNPAVACWEETMALWQKWTEELFEAALTLTTTERSAFLDRACKGSSELRQIVEEMLAEDERAGSFLMHPPLDFLLESEKNGVSMAGYGSALEDRNSRSLHTLTGRFSPGKVLNDRFVIIRFIAKGGMGEVYEAEDRFLRGVHIALKTILPHIAGDPYLQQRFEREVVLAREVIHPNLCPIYDLFHCDDDQPAFVFLTMKLLTGETLAARLKRTGAILVEERTAILRQMLAGLAAIHAAGIIHCDIKPNNIMLHGTGRDVRLFITDFGLARACKPETTRLDKVTIAGTPRYMAPELFLGKQPDQSSDIFALGVVLHELFTGRKPSMIPDNYSVTGRPQLNSSKMSLSYVQLVTEFLDTDPRRRCDAFERALDRSLPMPFAATGPGSVQ